MRKKILGLSIVLAAAANLSAQEAAPPTRVAVVNITTLFTNYAKAQAGKKELEAEVAIYRTQAEKLKMEMIRLQQVVGDGKTPDDEKTAATSKLVELRRRMEDLDTEVRKVAGKKQEKFIVELYSDVEAAIQRHADANNIDLVLSYTAPERDAMSFANITRKISAADQGSMVPLFFRPRLDITQAVLQSLNESYAGKE